MLLCRKEFDYYVLRHLNHIVDGSVIYGGEKNSYVPPQMKSFNISTRIFHPFDESLS